MSTKLVSKQQHSGMQLKPHRIEVKRVALAGLKVSTAAGAEAQREVTEDRIAKLVVKWDSQAAGVITVSQRADGSQYVVDGWGRTNAGLRVGVSHLNAEIHHGLTLHEEAKLFLLKNRDSKQVGVLDTYKVGVVAGEKVYVETEVVLHKHSLVAGGGGPNNVGAVAAIIRITDSYGADVLDRALAVAEAAWGRSAKTWDGMILSGLGRLLHKHGTEIRDADLAKKVGALGVPELVIQKIVTMASVGSTQHTGTGGRTNAAYAVLLQAYNKGRRPANKLA